MFGVFVVCGYALLRDVGWYYITTNNNNDAVNLGILPSFYYNSQILSAVEKAKKDCEDRGIDTIISAPEPNTDGRQIGAMCVTSDLPNHATSGHYIGNGLNKLTCGNVKCSCAATACESGFYLAVNAKGYSMGWCRSGYCPKGKHPNIVNNDKMTGCVND